MVDGEIVVDGKIVVEEVVGKDVVEVEKGLMKNVPSKFKKDAHHLLILHGRYVCKKRKPVCPQCVIRRQCQFEEKTT